MNLEALRAEARKKFLKAKIAAKTEKDIRKAYRDYLKEEEKIMMEWFFNKPENKK